MDREPKETNRQEQGYGAKAAVWPSAAHLSSLPQSPAEQNDKQKLSKMSHWGITLYYYTWYR